MRVVHPGKPAIPSEVVAQAQPPATAPPEPAAPAPEPAVETPTAEPKPDPIVMAQPVAEPMKPSPMTPVKRELSQSQRIHTVAALAPGKLAEPAAASRPALPAAVPAQDPAAVPAQDRVSAPTQDRVSARAQDPVPIPGPAPSPTIAPPPPSPEVSAATVPQPHQVTLNAGLILPVRLVDGLSSERNAPGDTFMATLEKEVVADGFVIAERGARVEGRVVAVDRAKVRAAAALALELTSLHTSDGQKVTIQTEGFFKHADAGQVNNTTKIAGGAIIGAAIGALAGGGKGAAIGAGVGGGAGVGDVLLTRRPVELASETLVTFTLKTSVPLTEQLR